MQGTYEYFAPELARLALRQPVGLLPKGYGSAVDDWAVGCILFEMLVGEPPFGHHTSERSLFTAIIDQPTDALLERVSASPPTLALLRGFLTHEPKQRLKCVDALERAEAWACLQTGDDSAEEHATGRALGGAVAKRREATGIHRTRRAKEAVPPKPPLLERVSARMQRSFLSRSSKASAKTAALLKGGTPPPETTSTSEGSGSKPVRAPGRMRKARRSAEIFIRKVKGTLDRQAPSPHKLQDKVGHTPRF